MTPPTSQPNEPDSTSVSQNGVRNRRTVAFTNGQVPNGNQSKPKDETESQISKPQIDPLAKPCHVASESLLSLSSGFSHFQGWLNWCILLCLLTNTRSALENLIKYGILIEPFQWTQFLFYNDRIWPSVRIILGCHGNVFASLGIERLMAGRYVGPRVGLLLVIMNLGVLLGGPPLTVLYSDCDPIGASMAMCYVSIMFLKLVSYHHVNDWCRSASFSRRSRQAKRIKHMRVNSICASLANEYHRTSDRESEEEPKPKPPTEDPKVHYPDNLTLKDIYYFILAPTLCYELNFPRSKRIRVRFLIKRGLEMLFMVQIMLALIQQWIIPTIQSSLEPFQEMNYWKLLDQLLILAVPNHIIWLMFFYWYFHSVLNTLAEILRFADRNFYLDWWNAESVDYFWRNWNVPVHRWAMRHVYLPLLRRGFSKFRAACVVFMISAFFHEYLIAIPLKMFAIYSFAAMASQIPFGVAVNYLPKYLRNFAIWLSLIIGQPMAIFLYYHDYYVINVLK